ncbi:MAG: acriflavine resistance protein B [Rhodobacteraceae bacterium]|nr:MAG: acriflavine resistance protein B [Paracoccaceae bacterium]
MSLKTESFVGGIISYFARHGTLANLLLAIMIVFGIISITKIRAQFFPDVIIETVTVKANWKGAGPEDIDNGLVSVIEPNLVGIDSVDSIRSVSREGSMQISIDFEAGSDMSLALQNVKDAIDAVQNLPDNVDDISVKRRQWRDRVTNVVLSGPVPIEQLSRFADEFSQSLNRLGVSKTAISGVSAPILRVLVPEHALIGHNVSMSSIASAIKSNAEANPAGDVGNTATRIRTGSFKRDAEQIGNIIVLYKTDGSKLLVGDVASIEIEGLDRGMAYFKNNNPAVLMRVDRGPQGDAIEMQEVVETAASTLQETLPEGVTIELSGTRAEAIKNRLNILLKNGVQGFFLVLILLFLFLSARTAFWVALGIPAAMLFSIAMMYAFGITLNMISLFALILCIGIVVDDAIIVGEHADFRARRLGEKPTEAAERGAIRMGLPVFTATLTTILAFAGLVAVGGRFGSLIRDIPFTVIVVLLASLMECFLVLPNHMRHALTSKLERTPWYDWPSIKFNDFFRYVRDKFFRRFTQWVIFMRYPLVAGAIALLAISGSLLISGQLKWRFFNAPETGRLTGNIAMLPGASRSDTLEMLNELQRATTAVASNFRESNGQDPITFILTQVGGNSGRPLSGSAIKDRDLLGSISIELIDADLRTYSSYAFVGALQREVQRHPLLETLSFRNWASGPGGDGLQVSIQGSDAQTLKKASETLIGQLSSFSEISGLEDNQSYDKNELTLKLTPRGESLGFTISAIGSDLYQRLNGIEAVAFPDGSRTAKIIVSLSQDNVKADFLSRTHVRSPNGKFVKLLDIVTVESNVGFSTVNRDNGQRRIIVSGDISEDDPARAIYISDQLKATILPELQTKFGIETELSGLAQQERDFLNDAFIGFALCLMGIYLALSWVFESWLRPIVIMAIIPFGLIGTLWGHFWWGIPLSMFSIIGLIGMTGIIINDSIVLISTIDEYGKKRGLFPSVIDATSDRLRPILLTTLTTVLGLLPLLFETSKDAQFLKPTVITLVYGLGFGMFVILFLVPALVIIQRDFRQLLNALRRLVFSSKLSNFGKISIWVGMFFLFGVFLAGFGSLIVSGKSVLRLLLPFPVGSILLVNFSGLLIVTLFLIFWLAIFRRRLFVDPKRAV